ncbi:MAG: PTS transporter subunit EIIA [Oligosphaeraceae bacterium]|nr:PTS transporter subunit EIIA [Oligosphaeraceae bacterium]
MAYKQLTLEQAATLINCSPKHLREQATQGDAPCLRQGDKLLFDQEAIMNWWSLHILNRKTALQKEQLQPPLSPVLPSALCAPDRIDTALRGKSKAAILKSLTALAESTGLLYSVSEFHDSLRSREEQASTALPGGVALVHPQSRDEFLFEESFICLAKARNPVFFGEANGLPSDIFFLLACKDDIHLQVLAALSSLLITTGLIQNLRCAETPTEMLAALEAAESAASSARAGQRK